MSIISFFLRIKGLYTRVYGHPEQGLALLNHPASNSFREFQARILDNDFAIPTSDFAKIKNTETTNGTNTNQYLMSVGTFYCPVLFLRQIEGNQKWPISTSQT